MADDIKDMPKCFECAWNKPNLTKCLYLLKLKNDYNIENGGIFKEKEIKMTDEKELQVFTAKIYLPKEVMRAIRMRKASSGQTIHEWLANIIKKELKREGYLEEVYSEIGE